jgi:hypothetical protein
MKEACQLKRRLAPIGPHLTARPSRTHQRPSSCRDIQIKEATNRAGLLSFLFHEIREPLKQTRQNQPTM